MNKKAKTALLVTAGIGAALGGTAIAAGIAYTEIMTSVIARRKNRATDALVAAVSKSKALPLDDSIHEQAQRVKETPMEAVEIRSHDRYVLRGRWYPAENPKRTVILAHGWHSQWYVDFSASTPFLHDNGCNLLFIDQRCHGESGGDLIGYGVCERNDILSWLEFIEANHGGLPVYLCGLSMGAATVLMATELPIEERVCGIIADSAYAKPNDIIHHTLKHSIGPLASPTLAAVNLNCKRRGKFTFGDAAPVKAMKKNQTIPCLFIHGDADTFVPCGMGMKNYTACKAPKDLLVVPEAEHGMSFVVAPDVYKKKVLDFFAAYDPPAPPKRRKCLFGNRKDPVS